MKSGRLALFSLLLACHCGDADEGPAAPPAAGEALEAAAEAAQLAPAGEQWEAVSLGGDHSCALAPDGTIWCWGRNHRGQLGNGTLTFSNKPVQVTTPSGVTWASLDSGWDHVCARSTAGQLYCWGHNGFGAVGVGTWTDVLTPTAVPGMNNLVSVGVGGSVTCVVKRDRTLWCWGVNNHTQIGDGTNASKNSPVQVDAAVDWATVEPGSGHTCATKTSGSAHCWGNNVYGQIGVGAINGNNESALTLVPGVSSTRNLASFYATNCAISTGNAVKCWGYNAFGQVGNGQLSDALSPASLMFASRPLQISVGSGHGCAVIQQGRAQCWGSNTSGQLGLGAVGGQNSTPTLVQQQEIAAIAAGGLHSCALLTSKALRCWGHGWAGQLGDGTNTMSGAPVSVAARP